MSRYHRGQFFGELRYSIRHPRRKDWFELRYAALCVWGDITYPFKQPIWFLQTLWAYRDILWNDRDWDYTALPQKPRLTQNPSGLTQKEVSNE